MRSFKRVTVNLGQQQALAAHDSASEVLRVGLKAPLREEAALDEVLRDKILEALNDPHPDIPASEVFGRTRALHLERLFAEGHTA